MERDLGVPGDPVRRVEVSVSRQGLSRRFGGGCPETSAIRTADGPEFFKDRVELEIQDVMPGERESNPRNRETSPPRVDSDAS